MNGLVGRLEETTMAKYTVMLTAPRGHSIPPLLQSFGTWLSRQDYGSVGYFNLCARAAEGVVP